MHRLKLFLNFIRQNKFHTFLNVFGFSISLMLVLLFGLYLQKELSVDGYHKNKDRIFRLRYNDGFGWAIPAGADLKSRYPEIESAVTVTWSIEEKLYTGNNRENMLITDILLVDTCYFSVFTYNFIEGNPQNALQVAHDVVLSESFARKLFGNQSALGQVLKTDGGVEFIVSGVVEDVRNSHMQNFTMITPIANAVNLNSGYRNILTDFTNISSDLYILAKSNADIGAKLSAIEKELKADPRYTMLHKGYHDKLVLEPLQDIYFNPETVNDFHNSNDRSFLTTIGVAILLVLLFAIINYINFSVAQTGFRAKEASLRRLLGASKTELFVGFLIEALVLCSVSLLFALFLVVLLGGYFSDVMNADIRFSDLFSLTNLSILLVCLIVLSCIVGVVPGIVIIANKPIDIIQGTFRRKIKTTYSKLLIGLQCSISVILIACSIVIVRQIRFMTTENLGFNQDFIIGCYNTVNPSQRSVYHSKLLGVQGVEQVGFSSGGPFVGSGRNSFKTADNVNFTFYLFAGDSAFFSIMGFKILHNTNNAAADAVWINETGWKKTGLSEDATVFRTSESYCYNLKGVVEDFHFTDFSSPIAEAFVMDLSPNESSWCTWIKISSADPLGTMKRIEKVYNELEGGNVFEDQSFFLSNMVKGMYKKQTQLATMMGWLSVIAIVISAMGMLAISIYQMRQQAKGIAIRKIFGATNKEVLTMILFGWFKIMAIAFLVAVPVIIVFGREWLSHYVYRISIGWSVFVISGISVISFAAITVVWNSIRTAYANPVNAVKKE